MPDPTVDAPEKEPDEMLDLTRPYNPARPALHTDVGYHEFAPSEFAKADEPAYCDKCGGGPDAEIHQKPVDQMQRIADAFEDMAESIGAIADEVRYRRDTGWFWRMVDWFRYMFQGR